MSGTASFYLRTWCRAIAVYVMLKAVILLLIWPLQTDQNSRDCLLIYNQELGMFPDSFFLNCAILV